MEKERRNDGPTKTLDISEECENKEWPSNRHQAEKWFKYLEFLAIHTLFIYLFGVLRRFQHCTGHIMTVSWKGRGNQYIQFARVLYCKLPTNGKQLPAFPVKAMTGIEPRPQKWEARVLPLCYHGPPYIHKARYSFVIVQ